MADNHEITKEKCSCGHRACDTWWLVGIGSFSQGSGFTEDEADRIISALNNQREKSHES